MSHSSPERPPVKVTYLSRSKRNKKVPNDTSTSSESEELEAQEAPKIKTKTMAAKPPSKAASRKETAPPAPASPGKAPKKVDVHLPGPSPRTAKADASPSAKKAKSLHGRSASSVSSIKRIAAEDSSATDSPAKKPRFGINPKRFATPDTVDDNASVAESSMGAGKIRRTEAERIEYFNNQPDCDNIEPHAVTCTRCSKVVNLGRKQTYCVRPWETHRSRCDQKVAAGSVVDDAASEMRSEVGASEAGPRTLKTAAERKAIFEADARAEVSETDRALCRKCQKWIRLSPRTPYSLGNWTAHQAKCADVAMSSRVAMAQRKIHLVNDPQAKASGPRHVECRVCDATVALTGESDYTLANWELHKQTCSSPAAADKAAKAPRAPRASTAASTAAVAEAAATVGAEASSSRGTKRRLEEPELAVEDPDARAPNRARKETYEPVQKEPPSILGWFLLPFKAFMQGMREGIAETPP